MRNHIYEPLQRAPTVENILLPKNLVEHQEISESGKAYMNRQVRDGRHLLKEVTECFS